MFHLHVAHYKKLHVLTLAAVKRHGTFCDVGKSSFILFGLSAPF